METSEPSLVPEWLKGSGSLSGGVSTNNHIASLHQDNHATLKRARNKSLVNINDHVLGPRTTSPYFRRSSSNGSSRLSSYSSFGRNNRDRDWDKEIHDNREKEKSILSDHRHRNYSDPLEIVSPSRFENDGLRRTQSTISRKDTEPWPRKAPSELKYISKNKYNNGNSRLAVANPTSSVQKGAFDRDFPSLGVGTEERQKSPEIGRVPSPGLGTAIQNLPICSSAGIGDVGWTSALAEVPVIIGGNGTTAPSAPQTVLPSSSSVASSMIAGLNMAETLSHGPPRIQATPQLSVETQRLEELAIKQSRQLIPVTPSMPKALVSNPSDKTKLKVGQQQQTSSSHIHNSQAGAPTKNDISKTSSLGKLQVLKPARDRNGVLYAAKDSLSPTCSNKLANCTLATASAVGSTPLRSPVSIPILVNEARKPASPILIPPMSEKRSTSQAKSRNDFFNSMRKKSMANSSAVSDAVSAVSTSVLDKPSEAQATAPLISQGGDAQLGVISDGVQMSECRDELISNSYGPLKSLGNAEIHSSPDVILSSEEEEAAFLRSLGWEENGENAGEDEGLTEEEINAFYRDVSKYISSVPSPKTLGGTKPKFFGPLNFQMGSIGGISSGVISSNSKLDS